MSKFWFSSDLHMGHENIISYCNRPFKSLEEMDAVLIRNWNQRVSQTDLVFHLGDFCFKNGPGGKPGEGVPIKSDFYEKQLNGKIIQLCGNHDSHNTVKTIISSIEIMFGGRNIRLIHNPIAYEQGKLNLCGHVHEKWVITWADPETPIVNVGVDVWNFMPISINEILSVVSRNPYRKSEP